MGDHVLKTILPILGTAAGTALAPGPGTAIGQALGTAGTTALFGGLGNAAGTLGADVFAPNKLALPQLQPPPVISQQARPAAPSMDLGSLVVPTALTVGGPPKLTLQDLRRLGLI